MIKRLIQSIIYRYNRLFRSNDRTFISAIDLMQPINGMMTAAQATVTARLLDVELIRQGKPTYWDVRLAELHRDFSEEEFINFRRQSEDIVLSLDRYGWDFNLSAVMVNREPLFAYNGTHRLGYTLQKNPFHLIPIWLDYNGWNWSREDGLQYYNGLTAEELHTIKSRYDQLITDFQYDLQVLLADRNKKLEEKLDRIGHIKSIKEYEVKIGAFPDWFSNRDRKFFMKYNNRIITLIRFTTTYKDLSYRNGHFYSPVIEDIIKSAGVKQYTYTPTITKSIEIDIWLKENCKEINKDNSGNK